MIKALRKWWRQLNCPHWRRHTPPDPRGKYRGGYDCRSCGHRTQNPHPYEIRGRRSVSVRYFSREELVRMMRRAT